MTENLWDHTFGPQFKQKIKMNTTHVACSNNIGWPSDAIVNKTAPLLKNLTDLLMGVSFKRN